MTDENVAVAADDDGVDWGDVTPPEAGAVIAAAPAAYPEHPDNPHNHRYTLSVTGDKAPMMVLRANTAAEMTAAINELEAYGVWANVGAAHASMRAQGAIGAGLGPVTPVNPQAPPPGLPQQGPGPQQSYPQGPAAPDPNQGPPPAWAAPPTPGYQQGPPPPQQYAPPPQQGGGGYGKPRPAGWAMVDVPFSDKDRFKNLRAQGTETGNYLRGKVQWGGKGVYWLEPSVAGWIAQQGFPVQS